MTDEISNYDAHRRDIIRERYERLATRANTAEARRAAMAAGKPTFIAALSCKYGHEPVRYTASNSCVECYGKGAYVKQAKEAREAGPLTWIEASRRGMRLYIPVATEAQALCLNTANDLPAHNGLFRVGLMRGFCLACKTQRSRVRRRTKKTPKWLE